MSGPNYCRIVDGRQKREIERTGVIPPCGDLFRCFPYAAGQVVFLVDLSVASEADVTSYAQAKHESFDGQEIWRVDFSDPALQTEPDKTGGAWQGAVVASGPVLVSNPIFRKLYSGARPKA